MTENGSKTAAPTVKRSLTAHEQALIERLKHRGFVETSPMFRVSKQNQEKIEPAWDDNLKQGDAINHMNAKITGATGTTNQTVAFHLLALAGEASIAGKDTVEGTASKLDKIAQSMASLSPQDEYEGQLVAQLVVLHQHAMTWLGKAASTERVDFANVYVNAASKLLTRHHETLEALLKYRRRGEQRVHVEHVHVHGGGQAIVGAVTTGGGSNPNSEEGPHAKV